ncbi:Ig-like domain-containing protein [Gallaecimonas pentaromativorans]|uniref:Cadherin-like domain-containing protein n=1 Tax=Gallaecimonas pentaromativorans TaxID=584787 RepID=A0A3N1PK86_9GAMM|nr:Ig-like domain-containing protein [Gallaecimonas pentaromativorans]ROQ28519.1 hypothetical protein EDC28_103112 [Gallaecimonas pentaromativorans]
MKRFICLLTLVLAGCGSDGDGQTNLPPMAQDANFTLEADTTLSDRLSASDANGDSLSFSLASGVSNGTLTLSASGAFSYTPAATYTGSDSFSFTVSDGDKSDTATVNLTITAQQVAFSRYSRAAFMQDMDAEPLAINGRAFTQDVTDTAEYADLLEGGQ